MYSRERIHVDELLRYPYRVSRVFAIFGKNWGPIERGEEKKKGKEKNRYRLDTRFEATRDYLVVNRRFRHDPGNRSYFLDKSRFEADNGRRKEKKIEGIARCSRLELPRFFSSSSPSWLRENRLSRINQSRP